MNRVRYLVIFFILILVGGSCSKQKTSSFTNNSNTSQIQNAIKLRIMGHWLGEGKKELLVRETVRDFAFLNQDLDISLEFLPQIIPEKDQAKYFSLALDSFVGMVKSNTWPWDVLFVDNGKYADMARVLNDPEWGSKYLVDFSEETWFKNVHKSGILQTSDFKKRYGGVIPGPLFEGVTHILFASEAVEKKLGISVKSLDMNLSDFTQYAKVVADYNANNNPKITFFSTQNWVGIETLFAQLLLSEYGNNQPNNKEIGLKVLKQVYDGLEKLAVYKPLDQNFDYSGYNGMQDRVLFHETGLFNLQPSWMYLLWNMTNPQGTLQMRPCELPSFKDGIAPIYAGYYQTIFVVPKNSQNPKAAERFIKFVSKTDVADKWVKYSKCPTGLKNGMTYTDFGQDNFDLLFRNLQKKYKGNHGDVNISKYLLNSDNVIDFKVRDLMNAKISAADAYKNVLSQIR